VKSWEEILFTYDEMEAQIVKTLLETEGIEVVMKSLKVRPYPVSIGRMGEIKLLVRTEDLETARELLRAVKDDNPYEG
jgi:hypothetical protein